MPPGSLASMCRFKRVVPVCRRPDQGSGDFSPGNVGGGATAGNKTGVSSAMSQIFSDEIGNWPPMAPKLPRELVDDG